LFIYVGVNGPPQAVNDSYELLQDDSLIVPAPGVLGNDNDPEGDPLTALLEQGPAHGDLTFNENGSFSYTPDAGFAGADNFSYRASDGELQSNIATVSLDVQSVNQAPLAGDDAYLALQDETLLVDAPGVLANDSDPLQAELESEPLHGTLSLALDGSFSYTPDPGFVGLDSFTYRAGDGDLTSDLAVVALEVVAENAAPTAADDAYQVDEDGLLDVDPPGVLVNDSDPDGDSLTAELVVGPANGSLTLNGDGSFSYEPDENFNGADSFTYLATDGLADSNTATVSLTVAAVNDAPAALDDSYEMEAGETLAVSAPGVLANDSDLDGDSLTAVLDAGPAHGVLTLNDDGSFSYTPDAGYSGNDSFTYLAEDGNGGSTPATVNITVNEGAQVERLIFLPIAVSRP
jgi:VCBS repeat-containing protein